MPAKHAAKIEYLSYGERGERFVGEKSRQHSSSQLVMIVITARIPSLS